MTAPQTFLDGKVTLHAGDNLPVLRTYSDNHFDAVICDPPYGIAFMGRSDWDGAGPDQRAFQRIFWKEVRRVLKPGGHLMAFGAARQYHRLAVAIEEAGFEIRDALWQLVEAEAAVQAFLASLSPSQADALRMLCEGAGFGGILGWVFGTGFPKGGDLAKVIDKHLGVEGTLGGPKSAAHAEWIKAGRMCGEGGNDGWQRPWRDDPEAVEAAARQYVGGCEASREASGFGPALKPALEPICLARKPFEGTLAQNWLKWKTGALNIDACRVQMSDEDREIINAATFVSSPASTALGAFASEGTDKPMGAHALGRFPAHLIHDGSDAVIAAFPVDDRAPTAPRAVRKVASGADAAGNTGSALGAENRPAGTVTGFNRGDSGSAARFFYSSKADDEDRLGLTHPTIKRVDTMEWLCRLGCRPGGLILDPFAGTGTTGEAAFRSGMRAVLIERDPAHVVMIEKRMAYAVSSLDARRREARVTKAARRAAAGAAPKPTAALDLFA